MIVSGDRISAANICSENDNIYFNLAENATVFFNIDDVKPANSPNDIGDANLKGRCLYEDVHEKYEKHKKIAILDDGFSALNIKKNLDIVLIDKTSNIFDQNVIPAGVLREPLSALGYANVIVVTKNIKQRDGALKITDENFEKEIRRFNRFSPVFYSYYKPINLLGGNGGKNALSFSVLIEEQAYVTTICAIGNPSYFYDNLISCGIKIDRKLEFEDHHRYSEADIIDIKKGMNQNGNCIIITTLKDYVKLRIFGEQEEYKDIIKMIYYLDFEIILDKSFFEFIYDNYKKYEKEQNFIIH